jgi:hypothetical protein
MKQAKEVLEPKLAAFEAEVFTQQVYRAIANKLLAVERRGERVFIRRKSFERWKANLETRRRMRIENQQAQTAHA